MKRCNVCFFNKKYVSLQKQQHYFFSMANNSLWQDDYWVLLMQLYQQKPVGIKPMYSRRMVELCMELHLAPQFMYEKMFELRNAATPTLKRLWERYADKPKRLSRAANIVRSMVGFSNSSDFYDGVETTDTFEADFRPIAKCDGLMPVMLILILDLYFRLIPATMKDDTPEVHDLAMLLGIKTSVVVDVMDVFQLLDPYLNRNEFMITPLLKPCQQVWQRYGNGNIEQLATLAAQLKEYFI